MDHVIPFDRLPPGFAESLDEVPDEPATPRPAATILMLRDGPDGPETLMLRRTRRSGFVPGAWVFAGGRVDAADADPAVVRRLKGLGPEAAARRLGLSGDAAPGAIAYFIAALREAFEETGLLVGITGEGASALAAGQDPAVARVRDRLLEDEIGFAVALEELGVELDGEAVEYVAHWITPVQERRRYDTRFFAAAVARDREVLLHPAEMTDSRWLTPSAALELHGRGDLPMVFPTIRTLEDLQGFESVAAALGAFSAKAIPTILPKLIRTPTGVGLQVP
jgi:8-oxo-dGTP pyrophosphatase MutT (NUDIX family)